MVMLEEMQSTETIRGIMGGEFLPADSVPVPKTAPRNLISTNRGDVSRSYQRLFCLDFQTSWFI